MSYMEERRLIERRSSNEIIQYSVTVLEFKDLKKLKLQAEVIDISEKGMGIKTDYPLQPGQVITFSNGRGRMAGVVKWCTKEDDSGYRAGVRFMETPPSFFSGAGN